MGDNDIIDINPTGNISFTASVSTFLNGLSPFGAIAQVIGKLMACRVQIKKLQVEAEDIKQDYQLRNKAIDGAVRYSIEQIELQRIGIENYFQHAAKQLELSRIYCTTRMKVMEEMTKILCNPVASHTDKVLAQETLLAMSKDLIISQEAGSTTITALIDASNKHLSSIPSLAGLLPESKKPR